MQKDIQQIEAALRDHLDTHPFWRALAAENPDGFEAVRRVLLTPGKRIRPRLFCAACREAGREPLPAWMPVALALELAHGFILIHDDILDRSAERRDAPTLPQRMRTLFAQEPADGFEGRDFSMVAGDLIYTLAFESLLQTPVAADRTVEAMRLFTGAALDTGRGALLEMRAAQRPVDQLDPETIEQIYALKTGTYTFTLPLQLAACFSGEARLAALDGAAVGAAAGAAFQLQNDLAELNRWVAGGPMPDDLRDGRRTWPLVYAGSVEALRDPGVLRTVQQAAETKARQALHTVRALPGVHALLERALLSGP